MFTKARARKSDPHTSHEAADSVTKITEVQYWVRKSLLGMRADHELVEVYRQWKNAPRASESSIRSRRAELVRMGLVEAVKDEYRLTPTGRKAQVWQTVLGPVVETK